MGYGDREQRSEPYGDVSTVCSTVIPELEVDNIGVELLTAMKGARAEMKNVGKSGYNDHDRYDYSKLNDYIDASNEALDKHGLLLTRVRTFPTWFQSPSGSRPCGVRLAMHARLYHVETGQFMVAEGWGEAFDKGDKTLYKAITGARKVLDQVLFRLYSGDDPEIDSVPDGDSGRAPRQRNGQQRQQRQRPAGDQKPKGGPPSGDPKPVDPEVASQKAFVSCKSLEELGRTMGRLEKSTLLQTDLPKFVQMHKFAASHIEARCQKKEFDRDSPEVGALFDRLLALADRISEAEDAAKQQGEPTSSAPATQQGIF